MDWNYGSSRPPAAKQAQLRALQEKRVSPDSGRVTGPSPLSKAPPKGRVQTGVKVGKR